MSNAFDGKSGLVISSGSSAPTDTRAELEERIDRMRYDAATAEREQKEAKMKAEIEAQTELSLRGNQQLIAARAGMTRQVITSRDVGVVPPMVEIERTPVKVFGGMEVSFRQAKDMAEVGQITQADFNKAVVDGLAARGYAAPPSFR